MDVIELLAFVIGPVGGVVLGPLMALVLVVSGFRARRKWPHVAAGTLIVTLAGSGWAYWEAFWRDFGLALAEETAPVPQEVVIVENVALVASTVACLALVATALVAFHLPAPASESTESAIAH